MGLPDPDNYSDWKLWAKAAALQVSRTERVEDNFISPYSPILDFEDHWASTDQDPASWCILKNGLISLSGIIVSSLHAPFTVAFTLPKAAWPYHGWDFGLGELTMSEVNGWNTTGGSYSTYPLFINGVNGTVSVIYNIVSGPTYLFLDGFTYRGAVSR